MAVTLDHVSGGRLDLGLGSGSWAPDFEKYGIPFPGPAERAGRLDEALTVLRLLFTEAAPSFDGRWYRLDGAPSLPRPVQQPHPPIHVGGAGERRTLPIVARHADVWNCPTYALAGLVRKLDVLRAECARIGRDPAAIEVSEEAVLALAPTRDRVDAVRALAARRFAGPGWGLAAGGYVGLPDTVITRMRERVAVGVRRFVFFLHDRGEPDTLTLLAREILPAIAAF
jgi:alkanesulfonate monooxygenase SsuD/methylene tetrahydromethanopterin reductase-like flavin-dependent oxidoreductase (luciferase family)